MSGEKPWGPVDPNSTHQRWSRWTWVVKCDPLKVPSRKDVEHNFGLYVRRLFHSTVGRARVLYVHDRRDSPLGEAGLPLSLFAKHVFILQVEIEGPNVHDPDYVAHVKREFAGVFVAKGFGPSAQLLRQEAELLAGSAEDGRPAKQLLVLPRQIESPE
jgi:hypothetical protein